MSGVIKSTDGETWFVNGRGWHELLDQALADGDASGNTDADQVRDEVEGALANQGLFFARMDPVRRATVAAALLRAARTLRAQQIDRGDTQRLDDLVALLHRELDAGSGS